MDITVAEHQAIGDRAHPMEDRHYHHAFEHGAQGPVQIIIVADGHDGVRAAEAATEMLPRILIANLRVLPELTFERVCNCVKQAVEQVGRARFGSSTRRFDPSASRRLKSKF